LLAALVRAVIVVVADELVEHRAGVMLVVDQHSVGALRSHAAHKPLCSRSPRRGLHDVDFLGGEHRVERCGAAEQPDQVRAAGCFDLGLKDGTAGKRESGR
jgi:hypothetical protein